MNYLQAINFGSNLLKQYGINNYSLDSEIILASILNLEREDLLITLEKKLKKNKFDQFQTLINRRKSKEPVAYILKKKEFWRNEFKVNRSVLIPRPETELIVEEILKLTNNISSKSILDVGTGSGCVIISIIKERPNCQGTALDICKNALKLARINAKMHHLLNKINFINIDIDKYNHNKYDFIVSNPPYIKKFDYKRLGENVRLYEPKLALEAGIDGLKNIDKLILKSRKLLKKNGKLIFEIGHKQRQQVKKLLNKNGFYINKICKDINSIPRVMVTTKIV